MAAHLVVMRDSAVGLDVALTLSDTFPGAQILQERDLAAAAGAIAAVPSVGVAVLELLPEHLDSTPLASAIRARGGRFVLIDGETLLSTGPTVDWVVLKRPFGTDALLAALEALELI